MLPPCEDECSSMLLQQPQSHAYGCDPTAGHYRGRLAPSPTGLLHLGHARTFWTACQRAEQAQLAGCGSATMIMRIDDLDGDRCKQEFVDASLEDLTWLGMQWQEGPDIGGPHAPYLQTQRMHLYRAALAALQSKGLVYRCCCSRKDIAAALSAPHQGDEEPVYPGTCRPGNVQKRPQTTLGTDPSTVGHQQQPDRESSCTQVDGTEQSTPRNNGTAKGHVEESILGHDRHIRQDQIQPLEQTVSKEDSAPIQISITVASNDGSDATNNGVQQPTVTIGLTTTGNVSNNEPSALETKNVIEANETDNQGMNSPVHGGLEHSRHHKPGRPGKQTVNSAEARQQLKAARRAERENRQAEARLASHNKQRNSARQSIELQNKTATKWSWRFRVPDGLVVRFYDNCMGLQEFVCGQDFGDFIVWRHDDVPSYQLACTVDDAHMGITEVVRGADLLMSTARQLLLAKALDLPSPAYYHCPLLCDPVTNVRLAKRHDALSLRALRQRGISPQQILKSDGSVDLQHTLEQYKDGVVGERS